MAMSPRDILNASRPGGARPPGGTVNVLAALKGDQLDAPARQRLERLGLHIEQHIGNKLVGRAAAECLDAIRADPAVAEVETSVQLKPHAEPGSPS
jgi:hypothetical protein